MEYISNENDRRLSWLVVEIFMLADVFEKFRNNRLKTYGLCLSHYLDSPVLSWDAMPSMAKVELKLIWDADMYLFFEKGMGGGLCYICKRFSKANNNYLKFYDPNQNQNIYLSASNSNG